MEKIKNIEEIANRMIQLIELNKLTSTDEIRIILKLVQKYELKTISNYSKFANISYNGVKKAIKEKRIDFVKIDNIKFILK